MQLPNITPMEVVMVAAAFVLLCVAPAVLMWSEARRRRVQSTMPPQAMLVDTPAFPTVAAQAEGNASMPDTAYGDVLMAALFVNPPLGDETDAAAAVASERASVTSVVDEPAPAPRAAFLRVEGEARRV